jgi:hypothetical protein
MDDAALANRLGQAGRAWVTRERTWASNGPRWSSIYDAVLKGRASSDRGVRSGRTAGGTS